MMNYKKYVTGVVLLAAVVIMACRDESLYPLPYDDRTSGHYLRIYRLTSNVVDFDDLANSAIEYVFESVDEEKGALLDEIEFYATHRSAAGLLTDEVLVRTVDASTIGLAFVPQPSYSEYLRSNPVRITVAEVQAAFATLTTDPDGIPLVDCTNIYPDVCPCVAYPGSLAAGDAILLRWKTRLTDGRTFTVTNVQTVASPSLGNPAEANMTPNVTSGQFYNAPYQSTILIRRTTTTGNPNAYTGSYRMTQVAVWSPLHNQELHLSIPAGMRKPFLFGSSPTDSTQTVTITKPVGGLPTEREFTCTYRGQTITMRVNLEFQTTVGLTGAVGAAALNTLTSGTATDVLPVFGGTPGKGLGFPAGTTNGNLGVVFVPLMNTGVDCTTNRELYLVTPLAGTFNNPLSAHPITGQAISPAAPLALPWGAPRSTFPNRGFYRTDRDGLTPGDVFSIAVDDDVDEYGRRAGYCNWYRRVYITFTKLP